MTRTLACAGNMKRRIQTLRESIRLTAWICRELSTSESNLWARRLVVLLLLSSLFGTVPGLILARIVNLATQGDLLTAYASMGLLLACYLVQKILEYYQEVARTRVRELAQHNTDARITELFFEKSLGQHIDEGSRLNIANIEKGRGQIPNLISMLISRGVPAIISMLCAFLFLAFLSPFAGAVIAVAVVITALWSMYLNEKVFVACAPVEDELRKINGYRIERWENTEKVKIFGKEDEEMTYLNAWFRAITSKNRAFWLWVTRQSLWRSAIIVVADLIILAYGLHMVIEGGWAIGLLFPLLMWSGQITGNMGAISNIEHEFLWNMPSIHATFKILGIDPEIKDKPTAVMLPTEPVCVEFAHVSHAYKAGSARHDAAAKYIDAGSPKRLMTLEDISFTVEEGEKVALIGPSGAGKTTIMKLLLRYSDPQRGEIRINGIDLRDLKLRSWLRGAVGYIPQQARIFDGTIRYNLLYGLSGEEQSRVTDDELWRLMRLLCIDFGSRLTEGLDTLVGRNGMKLSGGQAQRLMIGAAVLKRPRFMVIDEATSNLDSSTEKRVQDGLRHVLTGSIGALVAAHRLSTVQNLCSTFIVLAPQENGSASRIEAVAHSFEELAGLSPTFRQLAQDQDLLIRKRAV